MDFINEEANGVLSGGSSDEYYSSDEIEKFDDVDFHTEGEENVVIKNSTTHDPFLNKLCGNNRMFRDYLDESVPETEDEALDDPDDAHINPIHKAQKGVTYPKHDPTIPWNKMAHVLGMRYAYPEQLKQALANYGAVGVLVSIVTKRKKIKNSLFPDEDAESSKSAKSAPKSGKKGAKSTKSAGKSAGKSTKSAGKSIKSGIKKKRQALLESNPGSTCRLEVEEVSSGSTYFTRFYICFKGLKDVWLDGCRRIIGLDGCFLKHTCRGLLDAVGDWLPNAEHRKCTRHVYANFKKKYSGLQLQRLFWGVASSTVEELFYAKMDDPKYINLEAYEYLVARNPNSWCRAFFNLNVKCGGRGQMGVESGSRGGMGSGIGAMGTKSGGGGGSSGGKETMGGVRGRRGGARGRRGGGRGGRRGGGRGSTSGLNLMDEDDIRQSMEDEYMQGLLDEQEDLRQKQEKEHQDKLDEEALQQSREEEFMFERMDLEREREEQQWEAMLDPLNDYRFHDQEESMDVEMYNRTKASINFMVNTQESVTHGQPSFVVAASVQHAQSEPAFAESPFIIFHP
ncbi:hypothetical protein Tco_0087658 [Tanacetum coccineum]